MIRSMLLYLKRFITFIQVLIYLPLTLNVLNNFTFLVLTIILSLYYSSLSLLSLTSFNKIYKFLSFFQPIVIPIFFLLSFHLNLNPHPHLLLVTQYFQSLLYASSPTFSLLEGASTLLCIQATGQFSRLFVKKYGEGLAISFLILSSFIYVLSGLWLIQSYPAAASTPFSATLIGAALVATLAISALALITRRATVIETSLMFAYVAYSIWLCADAIQGASGWIGFQLSIPNSSFSNYFSFLKNALGDSLDFLAAAFSTLPPPLLTSLIFRTLVLYLSTKIIPLIRSSTNSITQSYYDKNNNDNTNDNKDNQQQQQLDDFDQPSTFIMTILVSFSRLILILVYSHLLLLDQGAQLWWRWANVAWTLGLWVVEIILSSSYSDDDVIVKSSWKID